MNHCKDCKHWDKNYEDVSDRLAHCGQPKAKLGYRWNEEDIADDGVWVENDEGWGWFMGPEFGCINWESK